MSDARLISEMVWAFAARTGSDDDLDDDPEAVITRTIRNFAAGRYPGGLAAVAAECGVPWPADEAQLRVASWAGKARWALVQRDRAIREAVEAGRSKRSVAAAAGLTPPAVDRILGRAEAANTRW